MVIFYVCTGLKVIADIGISVAKLSEVEYMSTITPLVVAEYYEFQSHIGYLDFLVSLCW
jgi:hypothetical protein